MNQEEFFKKPLSENNRTIILQSLAALSELGIKEKQSHVREAFKKYYDQLRNLLLEDQKDGSV